MTSAATSAAQIGKPSPASTPTAEEHHTVAAVLSPRTVGFAPKNTPNRRPDYTRLMDEALVLARAQFGLNIGFHILFPSLTIALAWFLLGFRIAYLRTKRMVLYRIADPGPGFCFDELAHAAAWSDAPDGLEHVRVREEKGLRPGGFGLLLTRALVDELIYNQAQNEVVFVKYLEET